MAKITVIRTSNNTVNKIEKIKLFISLYSILKGIRITDTEILILAAFLTDGNSKHTKNELLRGKLLKNENVLENTISKMRAKGLLVKDGIKRTDEIAKDFRINYDNKLKLEIEVV